MIYVEFCVILTSTVTIAKYLYTYIKLESSLALNENLPLFDS